MLKILVVGVGSIGQRHVRNLRALLGQDVDILAYRVRGLTHVLSDDMRVVSGEDLETAYGLRTFDRLDAALAERPDAAIICNPSSLHLSAALAAARAGCHVLVEKPLSHTADGVAELVDAVETRGLVGMVGYQLRFHPGLVRLSEMLARETAGRLVSVHAEVAEYLPNAHPYEDYRRSYAARSELGGGVVLSYIHELDYIYWLFGLPVRLTALGGHLSSLEMDVEDTADILMQCTIGGRPVPVHLHQDFVQHPPTRRCEVIGEAGRIVLDLRGGSLTRFDRTGSAVETFAFGDLKRNQLFMDELSHFLACIEQGSRPAVTIREAAASLAMACAARESMRTGRTIDVAAPDYARRS